jgi:hypothetical protein
MAAKATTQNVSAGQILAVLGAVILLVSLFCDWYAPRFSVDEGLSAFTAFEIVDLLLAALAVAAIATAVPLPGRSTGPLLDPGLLPWIAGAALVLVVVALINDPPGARDRGLDTGAWIALGGAVVIAAGALLSRAQISIVVGSRPAK